MVASSDPILVQGSFNTLFGGPADKRWEDGRNGMPYLPGSGYWVGVGGWAADDRRGAIIPREAKSQGELFGLCRGNSDGVSGSLSTYAAWESSGREAKMGDHRSRQESKNTRWFSQPVGPQVTVQSRGVRDRWWRGWQKGYTSYTGMSGTHWSY